MCRLAFDAARCRVLCLAFRLCPSLALRAAAARRCCCASSQRAGERGDGHRPGAFEARRLHVGRLRRRQREVRCECTRTARATTRRRPAERHARWHDKMHGNVQRVGGHHGRDSSQTGCATPITADALTGPKYRLSNDAGLVTLKRNSSPDSRRRHCCQDGSGRPAVGRQHGGRRHAVDADDAASAAQLLRRDGAHALEQRHARRQVAALRGQRGGVWRQRGQDDAAHGQGTWQRAGAVALRIDAIPADRHAVGRVVDQARQRMHEGRPGERSEPQADRPANTRRARRRERDAAGCRLRWQRRMEASWQRPPG